jgi:hypothetical protein
LPAQQQQQAVLLAPSALQVRHSRSSKQASGISQKQQQVSHDSRDRFD